MTSADCELVDAWLWEQDVNAWSSLAYVVAGLVLAVATNRHRLPRAFYALAAITVVEGVGSLLYHGRSGEASAKATDSSTTSSICFSIIRTSVSPSTPSRRQRSTKSVMGSRCFSRSTSSRVR